MTDSGENEQEHSNRSEQNKPDDSVNLIPPNTSGTPGPASEMGDKRGSQKSIAPASSGREQDYVVAEEAKEPSAQEIPEADEEEEEENILDEEDEEEVKKKRPHNKVVIDTFLDSTACSIYMTVITIYALFGDDIRLIAFTKGADPYFWGLTTWCLFCFALEIVLACYAKEGYFNSFFFWLDIISTVSLITDIGWIMGTGDSGLLASMGGMAKSARAGRTTRVIRVVRLIRLVRIVKLYKQAQLAKEKIDTQQTMAKEGGGKIHPASSGIIAGSTGEMGGSMAEAAQSEVNSKKEGNVHASQESLPPRVRRVISNVSNDSKQIVVLGEPQGEPQGDTSIIIDSKPAGNDEEIKIPNESRVSKKLSELTTKRVVILILAMLFILPFWGYETWVDTYKSWDYGLKVVYELYKSEGITSDAYIQAGDKYISEHEDHKLWAILYFKAPGRTTFEELDTDDLRYVEFAEYTESDEEFVASFDRRFNVRLEAWLSISKTVFVCIVLSLGSIFFSSDANKLVLTPIERMIEKVRAIAKNPLAASEDLENVGILSATAAKKEAKGNEMNYETEILETTIMKIGQLLALGLGVAGSEIIADNMKKGGDINPMIPGQKMFAIFGFVIISDFNPATEALENDVFVFVNQIAEVVHSCVHKYNGSANKNIGEAFLLVWKFNNSSTEEDEGGNVVLRRNATDVKIQADLAVFSFLKCIGKMNQLTHIANYSRDPRLTEKIPGYHLHMGFGLHMGWAIEGAIGSYFKIDASYLSPNVNISARLECATKQYGVLILISGEVAELMHKEISSKYLREVDRVTVKGSLRPIRLMTVDLTPSNLVEIPDKFGKFVVKDKKKRRAQLSKDLMEKIHSRKMSTWELYEKSRMLRKMRKGLNVEFEGEYGKGFDSYIDGNWKEAFAYFEKALTLRPSDGPSRTLMGYLESKNCISPGGWKGYRELTSKQLP